MERKFKIDDKSTYLSHTKEWSPLLRCVVVSCNVYITCVYIISDITVIRDVTSTLDIQTPANFLSQCYMQALGRVDLDRIRTEVKSVTGHSLLLHKML